MLSPAEAKIRSLKVYFSPKQEGSGDPSPENVRAITGWDGVKVEHCGKNLWEFGDQTFTKYKQIQFNKTLPKGIYTFSAKVSSSDTDTNVCNVWMLYYENNVVHPASGKHINRSVTQRTSVTFDFTSGCPTIIRLYASNNLNNGNDDVVSFTDIQLELGSEATEYEPYQTRISLPPTLQHVVYIESTGTQYIDLNFGFDSTDEIETEFSIATGQLNDKYIVSPNIWNNNDNRFAMGVHRGGLYTAAYGNTSTSTTTLSPETSNDGEIHKWIYNNYTFSIPDIQANKDVSDVIFKETTANLRLFYGYNSNTKGKIASYHHKKADGTEVNLIPCYRISDHKPGMWDTVTQTFYTNSGSGEFILGPAVNKYDVDWGDDVGTVYGGYVDLISGELVETWRKFVYPSTPNLFTDLGNGYYSVGFGNVEGKGYGSAKNSMCSKLPYGYNTTTQSIGYELDYVLLGVSHRFHTLIYSDTPLTKDTVRQWFIDNDIQLVRELATPITHTLPQSALTTLINRNTFWSNADKIEIEYDLVETDEIQQIRRKILLNTPHIESASGSVVSFATDMKSKVKDCKVYFSPVQDLNGYSKPWVGGSGKNLFNYLDSNNWYVAETSTDRKKTSTLGDITYSDGIVKLDRINSVAGLVLVLGQLKANQSYVLSADMVGTDGNAYIAKVDDSLSDEYTATRIFTIAFDNNAVAFTPTEDGIYELLLWKSGSSDITIQNAQLELGSTATAYEPYENICPISGWDGITIRQTGKNLAANGIYCGKLKVTGDTYTGSVYHCYYFPIPKAKIYIAKDSSAVPLISVSMVPPAIGAKCVTGTGIPTMTNVRHHTFDNTEIGAKYMCIHGSNQDQYADLTTLLDSAKLMITTDGYDDNYETSSNNLTEVTILFPQTIYGGYVDLVKGEVVEEWNGFTFNGATYKTYRDYTNSGNKNYIKSYWVYWSPKAMKNVPVMCDTLQITRNHDTINSSPYLFASGTGQLFGGLILGTKTEFPDLANGTAQDRIDACNEWFQNHPTKVIYKVKTPNTYSLTPSTITTLRGLNNIFSDSNGNIELSYWTH